MAPNVVLDQGFGQGGRVSTPAVSAGAEAVVIDAEGRIVVAGKAAVNGSSDFAVVRYQPDGVLDPGFGQGGIATADLSNGGTDEAFDLALQDDGDRGRGVANERAGDDFGLARFTPDGSLDTPLRRGIVTTDFAGGVDRAMSVVLEGDGIVAAGFAQNGEDSDFALARYTADGHLDPTFGRAGIMTTNIAGTADLGRAVTLTADGSSIVLAGSVAVDGGSSPDIGLVRYSLDGRADPTFGRKGIVRTDTPNGADNAANAILAIDDGTLVAAGYAIGNTSFDFALVSCAADGSIDTSFGQDGFVTTDMVPKRAQDYGQAIAAGPGGTLVVVGSTQGTAYDMVIARYTAAGALDESFRRDRPDHGGLPRFRRHGARSRGASRRPDGRGRHDAERPRQ